MYKHVFLCVTLIENVGHLLLFERPFEILTFTLTGIV